jgi:cytochrome c553
MRLHRCVLQLIIVVAALAAFSHASGQAAQKALADTLEQRLAACPICHGKRGEGSGARDYYPRLAGKPAGYLYTQLVNFREGRRKYPQMVYLLRYMPDAYLREMADYYAALSPPYPPPSTAPASPREMQRGEALAMRGDPDRKIPACSACHGEALNGMQPAIPGLLGLHSDYVAAQLGGWKTKTRVATAPDCMEEIVSRMSGDDISAVAKWLASRPGMVAPPAREAAHALPLKCGSQAN